MVKRDYADKKIMEDKKMNENEKPSEELNELSKAITNALIKSDEVINMLFELKRQNMI